MSKTRLEGTVTSIELTGDEHFYDKIPYVRFCIKNGSGNEESVELPINVGDNIELMKRGITGQKVVFQKESEYKGSYNSTTKIIRVESGPFKGIKYEHLEEV